MKRSLSIVIYMSKKQARKMKGECIKQSSIVCLNAQNILFRVACQANNVVQIVMMAECTLVHFISSCCKRPTIWQKEGRWRWTWSREAATRTKTYKCFRHYEVWQLQRCKFVEAYIYVNKTTHNCCCDPRKRSCVWKHGVLLANSAYASRHAN